MSEQTVSKTQLIESIVLQSGLDKKTVTTVLASLGNVVQSSLRAGQSVAIPDLAKFSVKEKPATPERPGINPFTRASITIAAKPASKKVVVKPVAGLKKALG